MRDMVSMNIGEYSRWDQASATNLDLLLMLGRRLAEPKNILIILFKCMATVGILGVVYHIKGENMMIRELNNLINEIRSDKCSAPSRCGKYGWRTCDNCSALQNKVEGLLSES